MQGDQNRGHSRIILHRIVRNAGNRTSTSEEAWRFNRLEGVQWREAFSGPAARLMHSGDAFSPPSPTDFATDIHPRRPSRANRSQNELDNFPGCGDTQYHVGRLGRSRKEHSLLPDRYMLYAGQEYTSFTSAFPLRVVFSMKSLSNSSGTEVMRGRCMIRRAPRLASNCH
jgi:hypothetical protein